MMKISLLTGLVGVLCSTSSLQQETQYTIVEQDQKKGVVDDKGRVLIPVEHEELGWSDGDSQIIDQAIGYREDGLWGLINLKNQRVTPPIYSKLIPLEENLIIAARKGDFVDKTFYGLLNTKGKVLIGFKYNSLVLQNRKLIVSIEEKNSISYGLIDKTDRVLIPVDYKKIQSLSHHRFAVTNKYQKIGIFESDGTKLYEFELDSIAPFNGRLAEIYKSGKVGLLNDQGEIILNPHLRNVKHDESGIRVLPFTSWKILTHEHQVLDEFHFNELIPEEEDLYRGVMDNYQVLIGRDKRIKVAGHWSIDYLGEGISRVKVRNKYGLVDEYGNLILQPIYDSITHLPHYVLTLKRSGEEKGWSLRNILGEKLTTFTYQKIEPMDERLFLVRRKGYWGYLNSSGKEVITCKFNQAQPFSNGVARVNYLGGEGLINKQGEWMIEPFQEMLSEGPANLYLTREYFLSIIMNKEGDTVYTSYNSLQGFDWGFIENNGGLLGLVNHQANQVIIPQYDEIGPLSGDSLFWVRNEELFGIVDKKGDLLIKFKQDYQQVLFLSEDYIGVKIDGKYGFIDLDGNLRVANRYDSIQPFRSSLAAVNLRNKWGFINKVERLVIQPHFDKVRVFPDGLILVSRNGKQGLIDFEGKLVIPVDFDSISRLKNGIHLSYQNEKIGIIDQQGKQVVYPIYQEVISLDNAYFLVRRKNKWGLMDQHGLTPIPAIYDLLEYDPFHDTYLGATFSDWEEFNHYRND